MLSLRQTHTSPENDEFVPMAVQAFLGRPVHIEVAEPKPDRRGGFGDGGFGGGGGFGGAPRGGGGFDDDRERPRYGAPQLADTACHI